MRLVPTESTARATLQRSGIAVISFDLFATLHCPSTSRLRVELHAEMHMDSDRRLVATTPRTGS